MSPTTGNANGTIMHSQPGLTDKQSPFQTDEKNKTIISTNDREEGYYL